MRNKSIIARLATSALIAAMTIGTVSSADSGSTTADTATSSVINITTESTGIIKYDRNNNGTIDSDDVYFTAEDINNLAESVNALSQNYITLNQKRLDIIDAMNATVTKKFYSDSSKTRYDDYSGGADMATTGNLWDSTSDDGALPTTASFDTIVQTLSTLTTPSTATATKYTATTNGWLSGTSSDATGAVYTGTSSQATTLVNGTTSYVGLNASGESTLTLGVDESLTLESGYYSDPVTINNGVVNRGTVSTVLTSNQNSITLPAGYYEKSTITTNITSLTGTIKYTHHQCSTTKTNLTYTDTNFGTSGAAAVSNLTTVNNQSVSTVRGGCYTTPYYYYSEDKKIDVDGIRVVVGYVYDSERNGLGQVIVTAIVWRGADGKDGYMGVSMTEDEAMSQYPEGMTESYTYQTSTTVYSYGTSIPSNGTKINTWYLKTCGYTNGQILSATITY